MQLRVITKYVCFYILIFICLVKHLIIYVFAFFRWVVNSCYLVALPIPYPTYDLEQKHVREFQTMSS